ncbi:MAG: hypothetical protein [Caudoviricetes sp.]|nr:MAG: hypothetical protein [Caudoviricetes sp.]
MMDELQLNSKVLQDLQKDEKAVFEKLQAYVKGLDQLDKIDFWMNYNNCLKECANYDGDLQEYAFEDNDEDFWETFSGEPLFDVLLKLDPDFTTDDPKVRINDGTGLVESFQDEDWVDTVQDEATDTFPILVNTLLEASNDDPEDYSGNFEETIKLLNSFDN